MAISTVDLERKKLLELAENYRGKGYEVFFHPNREDLPDFLESYRPDLLAKHENESVIVEVKSRSSLNSSTQYLRDLAKIIEQHPGWRFELVMTNLEDTPYSSKAERTLQKVEIETSLQTAKQLATQHPDSAILYSWSLAEAALRLLAEHEGLTLQRFDPPYLVKKLVTAGAISRFEYQVLMNALSLRNAVAHGFKTAQITQETVYELIDITEQSLQALETDLPAN